tara:strand:+ start:156 stop:440 length:285 start_codon:yes stop_codon:yes gene_type:complete
LEIANNKNYFNNDSNFSLYQTQQKNLNFDNVTEEFEAIFITNLINEAYNNKLAEGIFDSSENKTFQDLLNKELGRKLANKSNFGIADALKNQFK